MKTRLVSVLLLAAVLGTSASLPLSAADQSPKPVAQPTPDYAYALLRSRIEGDVLVSFTITATGDVAGAVVVRSSEAGFNVPVLNAIKQWKFAPAMKDGRAISTQVNQLLSFTVQESDQEPATDLVAKNLPSGPAVKNVASNK